MSAVETRRVMVVEDDPIVAMLVEDIVRDMGHEVLVNLTLEQAMFEIEAGEVHAVLLDMHLRGEDGRPILLELLARHIPFLVLSGSDQSALKNEFPQIRIVAKPFNKAALEDAVRELLSKPVSLPKS